MILKLSDEFQSFCIGNEDIFTIGLFLIFPFGYFTEMTRNFPSDPGEDESPR